MSETPRRFDDLVRTVADLRSELRSLKTTAMARLGTHTHEAVADTIDVGDLLNSGHEARYYQAGTAQTIGDSIDSQVFLNNAAYTTADVTRTLGDISVGSSFTINRAGLWHLSANVTIDNGGTGSTLRRLLIADATSIVTRYAQDGDIASSTTVDHILSCSTMVRLGVGATVAMWVRQESTSSRVLDLTGDGVNFSLAWIRA